MSQGWIKLHRKLLDSDMWKCLSLKQKDIMITCLLLANHKSNQWEFDGKIYTVKPGEFITSYHNLANHCDKSVSISSVRTAMAKLEKWNFLTRTSTSKSTKITICNWKTYQETRTADRTITDKQTAHGPQTGRKRMTTNKNDKECNKNDKRMKKKKDQDSESLFEENFLKEQELTPRERWDKILTKGCSYYTAKGISKEDILQMLENDNLSEFSKKNFRQAIELQLQ